MRSPLAGIDPLLFDGTVDISFVAVLWTSIALFLIETCARGVD